MAETFARIVLLGAVVIGWLYGMLSGSSDNLWQAMTAGLAGAAVFGAAALAGLGTVALLVVGIQAVMRRPSSEPILTQFSSPDERDYRAWLGPRVFAALCVVCILVGLAMLPNWGPWAFALIFGMFTWRSGRGVTLWRRVGGGLYAFSAVGTAVALYLNSGLVG